MNKIADFSLLVKEDINAVEALIKKQVTDYYPELDAALNILLSSGGKRIRPTLNLLVGHMFNAPLDKLVTVSAAIELLHTATLVHDDLIDNSLFRRGMPTLNSKWNSNATVLTGDFMFACAAKLAADAESVPLMKLFAKTLTVIVNGEITQLFNGRYNIDKEAYYHRIYEKTASLIETSTCTAAMISPVNDETIEDMRNFGYEIGIAFQIIDDVLDFTGHQNKIGKPVGSDLRMGLITLPTLLYLDNHPDDPDLNIIKTGKNKENPEAIDRLVESIRNSEAIQLSVDQAHQYVDRGLAILEKYPECPERQALKDIAEYFVNRDL